MKALKVIVDELPEGCFRCNLQTYVGNGMFDALVKRHYCMVGRQSIRAEKGMTARPDWCPLVQESEDEG